MESRDMKPRIVMAAPKNDGIFWRQKQYLSFERCTLASVFEEDGLFAELASGDTDLFLAVIDTSFFIRNRGLHTRLRENCSAPLVVAGKSSDPGVRFTMGFADHYLMLPEDEVVIAEIV
ncbi:MAG: hypothetical protein ACLFVQ_14835, partial [Chitinispirillaceae bacterium]